MTEIAELVKGFPERSFAVGEVIIREEQPLNELYFLWSGSVDVTKQDVEVHSVNVKGAVFGDMSYLLEKNPVASVTAGPDCVMKVVADRDLFIEENPQVGLYLARISAARLDSLVKYLVDMKAQFPEHVHHFSMINDVLDTIINRHPRKIQKELRPRDLVDD